MSNHGDYPHNERRDPVSGTPANDDFRDSASAQARSPAEVLEPSRAPERPKGRRRRRTHPLLMLLNGAMTLIIAGLLVVGGLFYFAKLQFDRPGPLSHQTVFVIPKGEGVNAIAERLEREGVISDRRIFVASVIYFKVQERLKAGEYEIGKRASMRDVLDKLVEGRAILHKVTIPEGLTSAQVVERLNAEEMLQGEIAEIPAEGSMLPDTYKFSRGMKRQDMIDRMQAEQKKFVSRLWSKRHSDLPVKTPEEAIILASIVEKETGRADERSRVAGVFVNRLNKGIPLQSDPTVIYGITKGKDTTLGRGILRSELEEETPYNTYKIRGLPPTPIANPGRAAIDAVLRPASTDALYFVADGSGGHAFATTLNQHNENVAAWRKIEAERRAREEAEARARAEGEAREAAAASGQPADGETTAAASGGEAASVQSGGAGGQSAASGLSADSAPGGVNDDVIQGLSIRLPPIEGQETTPDSQPETTAAQDPAGQNDEGSVPPPRRKPAS